MQLEMEERQGFEFMNFNEGDHLAGTLLEAGPETIEVPDDDEQSSAGHADAGGAVAR